MNNNKITIRFFMKEKSGRGQIQLVASCSRRRFRSASWTVGDVQDFTQLAPDGTVSVPTPTAGALWLENRLLLVRRATLNVVSTLIRSGEWSRLRPREFRIWISAAIMLAEREAMKRRGKKLITRKSNDPNVKYNKAGSHNQTIYETKNR